ncbi:hypothetical protein DACRYDRAFT_87393 [Dacryopinax primogenitus]|uniref:Uncharacterized protein n=1 Tax=Dacryopinax primogenitus (strain DJM 731) TaxID=1858805 RepID=M5G1K5_DACPD|nr:uncharacterized protein DACRYDRAFT_87393 [Dacryopinax primogenitus]EJU04101.1 hypothetical protein DACRYDRAFT_87393 [Dacryopinax primogenitus]
MTSMIPVEPTYAAMATSPTTGRKFFRRSSESHYNHPSDVGGAALQATTDPVTNAAMEEELEMEQEEEEGWVGEARRIWRRMSFGGTASKPAVEGKEKEKENKVPIIKPPVKAPAQPVAGHEHEHTHGPLASEGHAKGKEVPAVPETEEVPAPQ